MNVARAVNIADLRRLAKRRLPKVVFDYIDGGADDEVTLRENTRIFSDLTFRPRNAAVVSQADLRTMVAGNRERDARNGTSELASRQPMRMLPYLPQLAVRPQWVVDFLADGGLMQFPNVVLPNVGPMPYADVGAALERAHISWRDFDWIRKAWPGPIIVKGVQTADDARRAMDRGAAAIIVSNHGGRQLDGVSATLKALPE